MVMVVKDTFAERLKQALADKNMTAADLARATDTPEAVISQYKKGLYEPKQKRLEKFAQVLGVSIPWLMGYDTPDDSKGPFFFKTESEVDNYIKVLNDSDLQRALNLFLSLSPDRQKIILQLLESMKEDDDK